MATSSLTQVTGLERDGGEERDTDTAQEHNRTTTTTTQHLKVEASEATAALPWEKGSTVSESCETKKGKVNRIDRQVVSGGQYVFLAATVLLSLVVEYSCTKCKDIQ